MGRRLRIEGEVTTGEPMSPLIEATDADAGVDVDAVPSRGNAAVRASSTSEATGTDYEYSS
jgi:hypothetical protein